MNYKILSDGFGDSRPEPRLLGPLLKCAILATGLLFMASVGRASPAVQPNVEMSRVVPAKEVARYVDGRPHALLRLDALDQGIVLEHGDGPGKCDFLGARDISVVESQGTYYMNYDGAGVQGWLACLATSNDLVHWTKQGPVLSLGRPGEMDSASASYGVTYWDGGRWHMFYLGTPNSSPAPDRVPWFPYTTMKAWSSSPAGPWTKQRDVTPFKPKAGTYYSDTASPGQIVRHGHEYLMFFSASTNKPIKRTLSIARTGDLDQPWKIDSAPIVPPEEQVENSSLYFEAANQTWFLFTNHIGISTFQELGLDPANLPPELGNQTGAGTVEYTDSIWVYWTKDLNHWNSADKAIVLDRKNCTWSSVCIGLPSVVRVKDRLAILYDAPGGKGMSHMKRDVGLAWLKLPLVPPQPK
ncbi:MAG: hypothetical protein JWM88_2174 [Verrucomicrobia bacterium]|nr:hypothetical protein [Verrucomicrobiota bacterium]